MVVLFLLAAASALPLSPQPPTSGVISSQDYPAEVLRGEKQGAVLFNMYVDPRGKPLSCNVEEVYDADFSKIACARAMRTTFRPATNRDGQPVFGYFRTVSNFWLPESGKASAYPIKPLPDLSFSVKPAPGLTARRDVTVALIVNGEGEIADCAPGGEGTEKRLTDAACAQLKAQWTGEQLEYPQGSLKSYVRALTVSFEPESVAP